MFNLIPSEDPRYDTEVRLDKDYLVSQVCLSLSGRYDHGDIFISEDPSSDLKAMLSYGGGRWFVSNFLLAPRAEVMKKYAGRVFLRGTTDDSGDMDIYITVKEDEKHDPSLGFDYHEHSGLLED